MNEEKLKTILLQHRGTLSTLIASKDKLNLINTIIQIEENIKKEKYKEDIYKDIKIYIKNYIDSISDESFDYDAIDIKKMLQHVDILPHIKQLSVLHYAERILLSREYQFEAILCREIIRKTQLIYSFRYERPRSLIKILISFIIFCVSNFVNTAVTLLFFLLIAYIFTLPAYIEYFAILEVKKIALSDNYFVNHLANILCLVIGLDGASVKPLNFFGVVLVFLYKLTWFILIINFVINETMKRIQQR